MKLRVVDAFTAMRFGGNPAAVCVRERPLDARTMQLVASEMNLSETAFLHPIEGGWSLRWFTPAAEVKLCGHATLASAHTLWETGALPAEQEARFHTLSGWLTCRRGGAWIEMDFPATPASACTSPAGFAEALGAVPIWIGSNRMDHLVEVADETLLRGLKPNFTHLAELTNRGVIVTCRGSLGDTSPATYDFLSRFFAPAVGVNEDPVTGSAHCTLGPYWAAKLGKNEMTAYQASARGGVVLVSVRGERVLLKGQAVTVSTVDMISESQ